MSLDNEIRNARTTIVSDGYEMSIGELMNLYVDEEIKINPAFQRLFRWDDSKKTRFIESVLLGIPIPPIFVVQNNDGVWELIDGLQRLSTLFEFTGILLNSEGVTTPPSVLEGTRFLPSLSGKRWTASGVSANDGIGKQQQLEIKRARIRVEILKQESDPNAKYELFQRLNTGGAPLSEQEVRNCIAIMINENFYLWLKQCSEYSPFVDCTAQTDTAKQRQATMELALRFFAFRNLAYSPGLDVHEYLDAALIKMAEQTDLNLDSEKDVFEKSFQLIKNSLADNAFKRWDGTRFSGKFLMSVFEVVAKGVAANLDDIESLQDPCNFIETKCKQLWNNQIFIKYSGAGVRGTSRLTNLLPLADEFFRPV